MESRVIDQESVRGARGRRSQMGVCPHCGGNVRRVRDIYGSYAQCIQCSREVDGDALFTTNQPDFAAAGDHVAEELMIA